MYLYLILLLVSGAQGVALLRNVLQTGDWKTDNQYNNVWNSFLTLFIYTSSGENFNEAVNPALVQSSYYMWFFVLYAFVGLFFMTSLVVAIFTESYDAEARHSNSHKLDKWAGVCACFGAWADKEAPPDEHDGRPRLDFESFKGIMVDSFPHVVRGMPPRTAGPGSPYFEFDYDQLRCLFHFLDTHDFEALLQSTPRLPLALISQLRAWTGRQSQLRSHRGVCRRHRERGEAHLEHPYPEGTHGGNPHGGRDGRAQPRLLQRDAHGR